MTHQIRNLAAACTVALLVTGAASAQTAAAAADDGSWHFNLAPYFWAAGLKGSVSFVGIPEQPVEASFSDIIKDFDFGFASRFDGRKGRWGFATDIVYNNLGASIPTGEVLGRLEPEVDLRQLTAEGDVFYRAYQGSPSTGVAGFVDVFVGGRYNGIRTRLEGDDFEGTNRTFHWLDGVAGLRFQAPLGSKVSLAGRGDIAGLGSDFSWQLEGSLLVHLSERWVLTGGYRYYDVDYDKGDGLDRAVYKMATRGPALGVVYGW